MGLCVWFSFTAYPRGCLPRPVHRADDRLAAVLDHDSLDPHHLLCLPALAVEGVEHL
jgi:hypothetical protein